VVCASAGTWKRRKGRIEKGIGPRREAYCRMGCEGPAIEAIGGMDGMIGGSCQAAGRPYSNENGGPNAGTAFCDDTM